ncbi:MAG: tRNA1(Val) (adenine(37)-N6)-methyltransferase [Desulforhopalus sp.]
MNSARNIADRVDQSRDSLFNGELICYQHRHGYRFSIDAVLLAHFIDIGHGDRVLDLGTGCGVVSLILLYRHYQNLAESYGLEMQHGLWLLAKKNVQVNGFSEKCTMIHGDLRRNHNDIPSESFDRVVFNPPFYRSRSGRTNTVEEIKLARHQVLAGLDDFFAAAAVAVKNRGTVSCIYPAEKIGEIITCAARHRLEAKRIRFIYGYPGAGDPARLTLVHCLKNGGPGAEILPPLFIYTKKNGDFTPDMQSYYRSNDA